MAKKLLVVTMLLTLATVAQAAEPVESGDVLDARLSAQRGVVEVGADLVIDLHASAEGIDEWQVSWYWQEPLRVMHAGISDSLWEYIESFDLSYEGRRVTIRQSGSESVSVDDTLLTSLTVRADTPGSPMVTARLDAGDSDWHLYWPLDIVACAGEFNDDGVRDLADLMMLMQRLGCVEGDECWNPLYDLDGDGEITRSDAMIAIGYWNIPCP